MTLHFLGQVKNSGEELPQSEYGPFRVVGFPDHRELREHLPSGESSQQKMVEIFPQSRKEERVVLHHAMKFRDIHDSQGQLHQCAEDRPRVTPFMGPFMADRCGNGEGQRRDRHCESEDHHRDHPKTQQNLLGRAHAEHPVLRELNGDMAQFEDQQEIEEDP